MSKHVCLLLSLLTFTLLGFAIMTNSSSKAQAPDSTSNHAAVDYGPAIAKLKAAVQYEVSQHDLPAFSISLVDNKQIVWADGFGYQDADKKVPATSQTIYRVGSVSKLFTDIAVMQLVEQGKLDIDAPVQEILPDFTPENPYDTPITLHQLMSHRSGLVREPPVGNYFDPTEPTLAETIASLNQTKLVYPPNTKTKYSNAAVSVVGEALAAKTGMPFEQQIEQTLLQPLQMPNSSFDRPSDKTELLATGWMWTYDERRFEAPTFPLGTGPAGNFYSSVADLSQLLICLFQEGATPNGPILKSETLQQMITPTKDEHGAENRDFGIGFHIQKLDNHTKVGHGGAIYGFSTQFEALPERKLGVAAAASLDGTNDIVRQLTNYALRLMIATQDGQPLPEYPTTATLATERAKALIGTYQKQGGTDILKISELNGDVFLAQGVFRRQLRATSKQGAIVTDDPFGFGTPVAPSGSQGIKFADAIYERLPHEPPAGIPERWQGLIGEYGWDHNTLYILEKDGQLHALIEWFYDYPLTELGPNEFAFPDYGLYHGEKLFFARDERDSATEVTAAEVLFKRRPVGTPHGDTFKIKPVRPIEEIRPEAMAATPPAESGDFVESDLVELTSLDPTIKLDIRYATTNNFMGAVMYKQPKAFMQRPAAEALVRAHHRLKERGLGLLIHDAYRPWFVTKMFWDATPASMQDFVANPANGSRHNRGCAVDLTLYDLATGEPVEMVATYDEFSPRSFPLYPGGTTRQRWYRQFLRETMEAEKFTIYPLEWWHFDYQDWNKYRIGNETFEELTN
ncbi:serine hydrolase [Bremerella cremea]|uniref:D-alanyl-D-alanine dipeptidase n=1 Tax=Bremerella cremea TaxID=1031537 RepID=A0A368KUQ9_9BACT|nr:serine hydrolase [Bremerella cremea]RCS54046.1 serine hydrolase [Bremerella cremea]